jgi:hypothetical protein
MFTRSLHGLLILVAACAPGAAHAAMTFVDPLGNHGNERCLVGAVCGGPGTAYNGEVSIIHALEIDTGLTLVRADDSFDRIWQATIASGGQVLTRARYAAHTLELGYDAGAGFQFLLDNVVNGEVLVKDPTMFSGAHASDFVAFTNQTKAWTNIPVSPSAVFAFVLKDLSSGKVWTSNNGGSGVGASPYDNTANGQDHMVTFQAEPNHYFIAWEDLPLSSSDLDYNDMVLEVRFVQPVPLPAGLPLLVSGLLGLSVLRRRATPDAPARA